ncbi:hypothetical protein V8F33_005107 [Rhypophila sp. PSN 637]
MLKDYIYTNLPSRTDLDLTLVFVLSKILAHGSPFIYPSTHASLIKHPALSRLRYFPATQATHLIYTTDPYIQPVHPFRNYQPVEDHHLFLSMMSFMSISSPLPPAGGPASQPEWRTAAILATVAPFLAAVIGVPGAILAVWTIRRHRNRRAQGVSASEASGQSTQA